MANLVKVVSASHTVTFSSLVLMNMSGGGGGGGGDGVNEIVQRSRYLQIDPRTVLGPSVANDVDCLEQVLVVRQAHGAIDHQVLLHLVAKLRIDGRFGGT